VNEAFSSGSRHAIGIFAATILLFLPTWLWLGDAWLSDPYYSHGPLVLLISLYLVWTRRTVISNGARNPVLTARDFSSHKSLLAMTEIAVG
jgi:Transmembrane exosortase (Exosortase_EpsH)